MTDVKYGRRCKDLEEGRFEKGVAVHEKRSRRRGKKRLAEVVTLYDSNFRDPASALRKIADCIEKNAYGEVGEYALVLMADQVEVFGGGDLRSGSSTYLLLHAGAHKMLEPVLNWKNTTKGKPPTPPDGLPPKGAA